MSNQRYIPCILAFLALACTQEQNAPDGEMCFSVRWGEAPATRTVLLEDGTTVWWCPDEYIKVFSNDMAGMFYSTNAEKAESIEIRGGLVPNNGHSGTANGTYLALYPYDPDAYIDPVAETITLTLPAEQEGCSGSFADKTVPAVAISHNYSFSFFNVCGGACFSVTEPGITSVSFAARDGEPLAGEVCVGFDANGLPEIRNVVTRVPEVCLKAPEGGFVPGEKYYVMFLPGTLQSGLHITLFKPGIGRRTLDIDRTITVHRAVFGNLERIDAGLWGETESAFVDLGLSVLWASKNLGADSPEEAGDYYAWGETTPKRQYTPENYIGTPDGDAASAMNGLWHTPTEDEWNELTGNCDMEWREINGVKGMWFSSRVEGYAGASIFLPMAGTQRYNEVFDQDSEYLCSTPSEDEGTAIVFFFRLNESYWFDRQTPRWTGCSVRPVWAL